MSRALPALAVLCALLSSPLLGEETPSTAAHPNIVYILADDLGIGDLGCYNAASKIPTPGMDRLAAEGMRFTDVHSPSAVCTPTRYGVLTGRYCWRTRLKSGVLGGSSPNLIESGRLTVAGLLKKKGYRTGGIGKWHLGLGEEGKTDYSQPLRPGPLDHGFDTFFGIPASLDMEPYVWVEDDHVLAAPTETVAASRHRRAGGGGFWRGGPIAPGFKHVDVLPTLSRKAVEFIDRESKGDAPFFLYLPLSAPHTPWVPDESFRGKSDIGYYGDFVMQVDATVSRVLDALDRNGVAGETLVFLTSDNGSHWPAGDIEKWGHRANHVYRGQKADIWEGGHRVPFVARWPGRIESGSVSARLGCLTDLLATVAELVGETLPDDAGEDSFSMLPALLGRRPNGPVRDAVVHHSVDGMFAVRRGRWKLALGRGSGGFTAPRREKVGDDEPQGQLYDLRTDVGETANAWSERPRVVRRLTALLDGYVSSGRSRPASSDGAASPATSATPPRGAAAAPQDAAGPPRPPNIVLVLADDLGWADLGSYGNRYNETPNLDRLAAGGMRFTSAYAACPVCSPTRAAIQSGQAQERMGLTNFIPGHWRPYEKLVEPENAPNMPLGIVTVAESLRAAGYRTGYFGKWHLGGRDHSPKAQGYDVSIVTSGRHEAPRFRTDPPMDVAPGTPLATFLTDRAIEFMKASAATPFFVQLSHYAVHIPLESQPRLIDAYRAKEPVAGYPSNPVYAALLEEMDRSVGRIVGAIDELGLTRETAVIFYSDNGGLRQWYLGGGEVATSNAPLRDEKGSLYEGGIRVPLIVRWPGRVRAGAVDHTPVTSVDLYPTFLALAGAPRPQQTLDGESLLPLLTETGAIERRALYWHYPHYHHSRPAGAVRAGRHKLVEFFDTGAFELYDLEADVGESQDLAATHPATVAELRSLLHAWREEVGARMPTPNAEHEPERAAEWWSRGRGVKIDVEAQRRSFQRRE